MGIFGKSEKQRIYNIYRVELWSKLSNSWSRVGVVNLETCHPYIFIHNVGVIFQNLSPCDPKKMVKVVKDFLVKYAVK